MATDDMEGIVSFGELVQLRRKDLGLTRPELARRVGCSPVTVKKIERDERRPSRQIAVLLADHLLIPDADRDKFIRMARGELAPVRVSASGLVSLPAFLTRPDVQERLDDSPFVVREAELAALEAHLDAALDANGRIVFITGEAGQGKTRLAQAFVRKCQEQHPLLVAAHGNCNAFSGIGDPYLPFREILALLAGDIEAQWVAGTMSRGHAQRLWQLAPRTIDALLGAGPDLVDIFIPSSTLLTHIAAAAPGDGDLMMRLKALVDRHQDREGDTHVQQSNLFAQYARVLQTLARENPLLLMVDDLQWADTGSISLLFHLARHLAGHRILILGLFRPSDLRAGRQDDRHPLETVVHELQRTYGEIGIDLEESEGRRFVDAFLDTEPNRLDPEFREALFLQTGGHPLFTVEMLRGLQARGALVQDEAGRWTEATELDWDELPARVEGVIHERINRLSPELREILKIASVEGEVFTAEIVAHAQQLDERQVISLIVETLNRQHRLVKGQDQQQLASGALSRYRFRHILFQQYLYNSLDLAERVYLHRAVGSAMEQVYGERAASIAPQLARHFDLAGDAGRALHYFTLAGNAAAAAHAPTEALAHYRRAIEIVRRGEGDADGETLSRLYSGLGRALELNSQFEQALAAYEEMETLAHTRNIRHLELDALTAQVTLYATFTPLYAPQRAELLAERALALARALNAQAAEARILWLLIFVYAITNRLAQAIDSGERSLALARRLNLREQMAYSLNDLGSHVYLVAGPVKRARAVLEEAISLWRELDNRPMLANSISAASLVQTYSGEYEEALALSDEAFRLSQSIDNLWGQSYSRFRAGYIYWERGEPGRALATMDACIHMGEASGFMVPQAAARADVAYVQGSLGAIEQALQTARRALTVAEEHVPPFRLNVLGVLARLYLLGGNLDEAQSVLDQAGKDPTVAGWPLHYVPVRVEECELALRLDELGRAVHLADALLTDLHQMGARMFIPRALYLQGEAYLGLGQNQNGYERLLEARSQAETIGSLPNLWPVLFRLSRIEPDPHKARTFLQEARGIVNTIAYNAPTPALHASFLERPDVRALFAE